MSRGFTLDSAAPPDPQTAAVGGDNVLLSVTVRGAVSPFTADTRHATAIHRSYTTRTEKLHIAHINTEALLRFKL